jgi:hypothetical protein
MAVSAEACSLLDAVLIDDAKRTKSLIFRVEVGGEGEGVEAIQPAMVSSTTVRPRAFDDFHG